MIVIPGKIPISIHPFFWLFAVLIGWLSSGTFYGALLWLAIIFVSVLVHEFGHALTALAFGQTAAIQLIAFGGLTSYEGPKLRLWKQFLVVLNGPIFGFVLFLLATLALQRDWSNSPLMFHFLRGMQIANLFWTIVNLFPVLPLDGGQLLRIVLESCFGLKGYRAALLVGAVLATFSALFFFVVHQMLAGALFFLFAFQSFDLWRKSQSLTLQDQGEEVKKLLLETEKALAEGRKNDAEEFCKQIRSKTGKGVLYLAATQYLAFFDLEKGKKQEAYELLVPLEAELSDEARLLLFDLCIEQKNWSLVTRLSAECYRTSPNQTRAIGSARAFAHLNQPKPAGGWLQTAWQYGELDLEKVLQEEEFQKILKNRDFADFIEKMR